ncbi:MAG: hypothetical protein ABSG13_14420 [Bryobacteraceae bacterium]|jgi:hypothetical protein
MRCLYCGKELALLKRLRGGGDFCSDAHKQSYQEEYNRLALSRLLQAQKKGKQAGSSPAENAPPPPNASVALEEPVALEDPVAEEARVGTGDEATVTATAAPVLEVAQAAEAPEAAADAVELEESPAGEEETSEAPLGAEPEPVESAGFLLESPALASVPDLAPCVETWQELSPGPAMSEWQIQNGSFGLSSASAVSLDLLPKASNIEKPALSRDLVPQAFAGAQPSPAGSLTANAKKIANANRLPASSVMAVEIAPSSADLATDHSLVQALGFESTVSFDDSQLLQLWSTAIDFPAEDAGPVVLARDRDNNPGADLSPSGAKSEVPGGDTPRASLEALSRLHQELVEQEAARVEEKAPELEDTPVEVVKVVSVVVARPQTVPDEIAEAGPAMVEIAVEQPEPAAQKPQLTTDLFELSIKTFPPAKAALIEGQAFPSHNAPLLPHLKSLPLRPKIALAPEYVPPGKASAQTKPATPAAAATRTQATSRPTSGGKPAARLTQPKQPSQPAKPVQPAATTAPEPKTPEAGTPASAKMAVAKTASPKADATKPVVKPVASQAASVQEAPKAPPTEKEPESKPAPAANQPAPAANQPAPAANQPKPTPTRAKPGPDQTRKDNVPSFGIAEPANAPWLSSLKVKLGLAILLLVIACAYFLGWGGKSRKPASSNSAVSADGSGPSIIMGEGGWVEGWGGDPGGVHAGRQITIYRPSLKLSDYRLEFQGSIDTKSVGWVFRAADPENYYAMKLMTVSSGLSAKVALFKYLVVNGRQTQVGRVPIDLPVQADTVFNIRVDVRGPQFTTYIQGQKVDSWTDDQLKIGGAGFLNEREERGKVKSVSIRYLSGPGK